VDNPFRVEGVVRPPHFADREDELARIDEALRSPGAKLLVYGPRRMGKTSAIVVAKERYEQEGGAVVLADFSTASSVAGLSRRLLLAAGTALGRRWRDLPTELVRRLDVSLTLEMDPGTGMPVPKMSAGLRDRPLEEQYETLGDLLDALEEMARARDEALAVVLDEFQEIHRFGGEDAEWRLRGILQHHQHTSYVLAGSRASLIRRMVDQDRAFYKLANLLAVGPIAPGVFAGWIDDRFAEAGFPGFGVGPRCVWAAGPRTRDVVQLARRTFDWMRGGGEVEVDVDPLVQGAFREIVAEEDDLARTFWGQLTANQQNVLRAVAAAEEGLTTRATLDAFGLPASGSVSNLVTRFVEDGTLVKVDAPPGYDFDSPFLRGWVVEHALADIGATADLLDRPAGRAYVEEAGTDA